MCKVYTCNLSFPGRENDRLHEETADFDESVQSSNVIRTATAPARVPAAATTRVRGSWSTVEDRQLTSPMTVAVMATPNATISDTWGMKQRTIATMPNTTATTLS